MWGKVFQAADYTDEEAQQAGYIDSMLGECWADVVDGGPTFTQH